MVFIYIKDQKTGPAVIIQSSGNQILMQNKLSNGMLLEKYDLKDFDEGVTVVRKLPKFELYAPSDVPYETLKK